MKKIKEFFQNLWAHICFPFCLIIDTFQSRKFAYCTITQADIDFLKSVGIDIDLNMLKKISIKYY
ncbi:MAG: hypothetical protein J1G07_06465 [Clostridiales bacterium]|nr:hypothetical protein [Clostridiales bacterium]